jgi:hypothetical protein
MKKLIYFLSAILFLSACNSKDEESKTVDPKDIQTGEAQQDSLSPQQIAKIKKIQSTFSDVYPISLKESIANFKGDLDPDKEIDTWLNMTSAYEKYLDTKDSMPNQETKKEIFQLILFRSMMPANEAITSAKLKILTEKEALEALSFYTAEPDPIDVVKKEEPIK